MCLCIGPTNLNPEPNADPWQTYRYDRVDEPRAETSKSTKSGRGLVPRHSDHHRLGRRSTVRNERMRGSVARGPGSRSVAPGPLVGTTGPRARVGVRLGLGGGANRRRGHAILIDDRAARPFGTGKRKRWRGKKCVKRNLYCLIASPLERARLGKENHTGNKSLVGYKNFDER